MIRVSKIERSDARLHEKIREELSRFPILEFDVDGEYVRYVWKGWKFLSAIKHKKTKAVRFGMDFAYIVREEEVLLYSYVPYGGSRDG